jgi:hypothetical protein
MLSRKKNVYPVVSIGEDLDITFSPIAKWDKDKVRDAIECFLFDIGLPDPIINIGYITQEVGASLKSAGQLRAIEMNWEAASW